MKILSANQIREADRYTIEQEPVKSIDLMERAANQLYHYISEHIGKNNHYHIFTGPGNNGGDGYALARLLAENDFQLSVWKVDIGSELSEDAQINLDRVLDLGKVTLNEIKEPADFPKLLGNEIIIDALFGSGLSRPLEGLVLDLVQYLNQSEAMIISIDIPSGLMAEDNDAHNQEYIIKADLTLTFELPKLSFFFGEHYINTGRWQILPIGLHPDFIQSAETTYFYIEKQDIQSKLRKRKKFDHKGRFGHAFLVSGSYGKMGAAVLAARGCLRGGVGLLTVHIPRLGYEIVQTTIPEAMTSIDKYDKVISKIPSLEIFSAVGIGPGIGKSRHAVLAMKELLGKTHSPLVIDADAINILAENREMIEMIPPHSILTPHPKEFERLIGTAGSHYERLQKQIQFAVDKQVVIVLKGAHTCVADEEGNAYFNSTGNPGMAKGGCGDVLTGLILALAAQGYSSADAAKMGVYVHGLAADLAIRKQSSESLLSSDIINYFGKAFDELKKV